ncbi:conserved hypothetical protein [Desulfosarcina cetonica]|nr:conserved hypothetical protein [Desulfosarcina cetonica]
MGQGRILHALQLGGGPLGQDLAQFHAPLIEGIDVPDGALGEHAVLVERHQHSQGLRRQAFDQEGVAGAVALEDPVRREPVRRTLGFDVLQGLAESQGLALGKKVGHQKIVVLALWVQALAEPDEVARDQPGSLVDQLVERMLAVGAGFAPIDRGGLVADAFAVQGDALAIAFHGQLLEVGRKAVEILVVGQHRHRGRLQEIGVPDGQKPHEYGQVFGKGRPAEMHVHLMKAGQHLPEALGPDGQHGGQADGRVHGVAPAHPVPEAEHVGRVDAEAGDALGVGGNGHEVPGHGGLITQFGNAPRPGGMGVGQGLQGREGLGADDEERFGRVQVEGRLGKVGTVDVGDEAHRQVASAVVAQGFVGHDRPQVGAADADVDDIADRQAGEPLPAAVTHPFGEGGHAIQHRVHLGHHVGAINHDPFTLRRP